MATSKGGKPINKEEILAKSQNEYRPDKDFDEREKSAIARSSYSGMLVGTAVAAVIVLMNVIMNFISSDSDYNAAFSAAAVISAILAINGLLSFIRLRKPILLVTAILAFTVFALSFIPLTIELLEVL